MNRLLYLLLASTVAFPASHAGVAFSQNATTITSSGADDGDVRSSTLDSEQVLRGLRDEDSHVRSKTLGSLFRMGILPPLAVDAVGRVSTDDTMDTNRISAIHVLAMQYSPKRLEYVTLAIEDNDAHVRANAAVALGGWGRNASSALPKLLAAFGEQRNDIKVTMAHVGDFAPVRYHIATAIGQIGTSEAEDAINQLVNAMNDETGGDDGHWMVRIAAALAVIQMKNGDAKALEFLTNELSNDSEDVRYESASSITMAGPKAVAALEIMLTKLPTEESWLVRSEYMSALGSFGVRDERIVRILTRALDEKDFVREEAIRSLARLGTFSRQALPKVVDILMRNRDPDDSAADTQSAAIEAVLRIAEPEEATRILRDKLSQVKYGVLLAQEIVPQMDVRGQQAEKNRLLLKRMLEVCRETEKRIIETLDPKSDTLARP